jgi:serine protease AprX
MTGSSSESDVGDGGQGRGPYDFPLRDADGRISVLLELAAAPGVSPVAAMGVTRSIDLTGFDADERFTPVPLTPVTPGPGLRPGALGLAGMTVAAPPPPSTYIVRGRVDDESMLDELRHRPEVLGAYPDGPVAPFPDQRTDPQFNQVQVSEEAAAGACPIPPCDCSPGTAHGTIADVANYLGASDLWSLGFRGTGIVVGVVVGGITAQGRPIKPGETARRIPRVIGGWPDDWGTEAGAWGEHGNMTSTDVLGMAPDAQIYDLRISGAPDMPATISRALQAFQWAIDQHRRDGTPQVLSNSWGIFQESWDTTYARDPNHPFTRKVVEAIGEGILVLFAAGNCGGTCPDGRCGPDNGPGRSIWGANSHPLVMTVGAVNKDEQFVGYSSEGPGALDANKPDFCSVTHFQGYFGSDSGTSAATPILSGCVALLKQAFPSVTQAQVKDALRATAKDIGPAGFDQESGAGIVRVRAAYDRIRGPVLVTRVRCPSLIAPCISRTVVCSSLVCPTRSPACPSVVRCPSRICPSVAIACTSHICPSLACAAEPAAAGQVEWQDVTGGLGTEYWYGGEELPPDPAAAWYGWYGG